MEQKEWLARLLLSMLSQELLTFLQEQHRLSGLQRTGAESLSQKVDNASSERDSDYENLPSTPKSKTYYDCPACGRLFQRRTILAKTSNNRQDVVGIQRELNEVERELRERFGMHYDASMAS